jgi:mannose-6-phosphate isomerase-like protein (cupin superfamily)
MDPVKVEKQWAERGFSCGIWADPPGKVWAEETHEVDQLVMLIDGVIEISIPGKTFSPAKGEEVLVPAGTPHKVRNPGAASNRWYYGYKSS